MATNQNQPVNLAARRQERAQALIKRPEPVTTKEFDTSTITGQISQTREDFEKALTPFEKFKQDRLFPKKREAAFTPRKERIQRISRGKQITQQVTEQLSSLTKQQKEFEISVAKSSPENAKPEIKQQVLDEAKIKINSEIDGLNKDIQHKLDRIKYYKDKEDRTDKDYGDRIDDYNDDISEYKSELKAWAKGLKGDNETITSFYSGETKAKARYARREERASNNQSKEFRKFKRSDEFKKLSSQLGVSSQVSRFDFNRKAKEYNQLIKAAEQKGGVQFLTSSQQKVLGFDSKGYTYYKDRKGWVDPITKEVVKMSISPEVAAKRSYLPVSISAYNPSTKRYIVESKTGLLTPKQQRIQEIIKKYPKSKLLYTDFKPTQLVSRPMPTSFELGGPVRKQTFEEITGLKRKTELSPYEISAGYIPKSELERIQFKRMTPIQQSQFISKKGYAFDEGGKRFKAYSGSVSPVTALDITTLVGGGRIITSGAKFGIAKGIQLGSYVFSEPIVKTVPLVVEKIIPAKPTGFALSGLPSQIGRGALFYGSALVPGIGTAFIKEISTAAATNPREAIQQIKQYALENPYELATAVGLSKAEIRIRQRISRGKLFNQISDDLIRKYGTSSKEIVDFNKAWKRAFKELPKQVPITKRYTSSDLKAIAKGDSKMITIIDDVMKKYKPEVIGSTVITPQTTLKKLPRGKAGDIDIQQVGLSGRLSKKMAYELYDKLNRAGYKVKIREGDFFGNKKYHLTYKGQELVNIGTSSRYFLETQAGPLRDLFEFKRIGQFTVDPLTGIKLGGIRAQLRVKIAKGYTGRAKDVIDVGGIVKGTEYLIKEGKYIGPKAKVGVREVVAVGKEIIYDILTGKPIKEALVKPGTYAGYDYSYSLIGKRTKIIPKYDKPKYTKPKYVPPRYSPANYLVPKYTKPKYTKQKYVKPKYTKPTYPQPKPKPFKNLLIPKRSLKVPKIRRKKKEKKKKEKYGLLPTITQQIYRLRRKGGPKRRVTGFEALRV